MGTLSTWETLLLGVFVILLLVWFRPGIKASLARGREVEKDWPALLVPLGFVILLVIMLIIMV